MKRFDELLTFIGANKKKEIIKLIAINASIIVSSVVLVIFIKQWMLAFGGLMTLVISNYLYFNSCFLKKKDILQQRENEGCCWQKEVYARDACSRKIIQL